MCWANNSIFINLIIEHSPNSIFITDACDYGLEGFSVRTRKVFYYKIPAHLRFHISNNMLKFLSEVIAIKLGVLDKEVKEEFSIFIGTDNTSAVG